MDALHVTDAYADRTPALLWREMLGRVLRLRRTELGLTLAQVSRRSGVSTQYLSEVERGLKDPSSEVIEAIAIVLGLALPQVLVLAAGSTPTAAPATVPAFGLTGRAQLSLVA
ncbi:MAG: helix-turn-helix domain-containing protein [Brevibacterium aurantiacum]|uniref:Helix-turn-helix domain protein n=4 Tax=Brevibacterium TaxID=1696 RepID=A0A1D7W0Q3_BREAU|nr:MULTISPECIES: helix-turn-helix transcriptional regulator [Brevibacterium]AOP52595.1 helix-turn-helix domain protein [Brevibacterium aurantiacum]MDN5549403.1 helix-turn-helix domain-containing protein [Brevibacterium sp.]MDN5593052.1 helix-turn-helix domain-containing protein [Brevibacterium sp.]MDN5607476.1 helix-turn-helix domain-containing protein [Brevibacterium sp.]MDN5660270.1 helix-turn-helix domain-containing protein [Brevibacterium aurantiacum]